ncbi:hypothetical protein SCUCBS95973_000663 [Sporothrix curviconia]|uniref:FAD-binding FR-type domain-containing protein n=1 Tax=Sporothrix curviconia TaxID=1260050 RepID=A0ABP0AS35_9PEZI
MPTKPPSIKQVKNQKALALYALSLCALVALVALLQRVHSVCEKSLQRRLSTTPRARIARAVLSASRYLDKQTKWKRLGEPTRRFVLLGSLFLAINALFCVNIIAGHQFNFLASRFGWMATANMIVCVLFMMRNSPLTSVVALSHVDLRRLHVAMAYLASALVVLHGVFYSIYFVRLGRWEELFEAGNVEGFFATAAMVVLVVFGLARQRRYELFFVLHAASFAILLPLLYLHRPDWAKRLPLLVAIMGSIWGSDRIARLCRMVVHLVLGRDRVTVHALPGGGTQLFLQSRRTAAALPALYCYLWVPQISAWQTHPFTIVSNGSRGVELVIKAADGFTRELYERAHGDRPPIRCASLDGPYGSLPDTAPYDKLVLVAGGSGAAYTFGLINYILGNGTTRAGQAIDFVWAVRTADMLSWFTEHLLTITDDASRVHVSIYITGGESSPPDGGPVAIRDLVGSMPAKSDVTEFSELEPLLGSGCESLHHTATVVYGKMSTDVVVGRAMKTVGEDDRALVVGCGPHALIEALKQSVDGYQAKHALRIDVYCEDYGS